MELARRNNGTIDEHIFLDLEVVLEESKPVEKGQHDVHKTVSSPFSTGNQAVSHYASLEHGAGISVREDDEDADLGTLSTAETFKPRILRYDGECFSPWTSIKDVKLAIEDLTGIPRESLHVFHKGTSVHNRRTLNDLHLCSGDLLLVVERRPINSVGGYLRVTLPSFALLDTDCEHVRTAAKGILSTVRDINKAFRKGLYPKLADEGLGGTYFLRGAHGHYIGVFKPGDEEAMAEHNPRGLTGKTGGPGMREGVRSGTAHRREAAAYLLDREGFASVPPTCLAEAQHPSFCGSHVKQGSFQKFVDFDDVAGDLSSSLFPVDEVHKIAILDIRLNNADRNEANILVKRCTSPSLSLESNGIDDLFESPSFFDRALPNIDLACSPPVSTDHNLGVRRQQTMSKKTVKLIPIDHGLCLPSQLGISWFEVTWVDWKQAKEPFSKPILQYIDSLDPDEDGRLLDATFGLNGKAVRLMKCSTILLKEAARAGCCLFDIAKLVYRQEDTDPSRLERMIQDAEILAIREYRARDDILRKAAAKKAALKKVLDEGGSLSALSKSESNLGKSNLNRQCSVPDLTSMSTLSVLSRSVNSLAGDLIESKALGSEQDDRMEALLEEGGVMDHYKRIVKQTIEVENRRRHSE